VPVIVAILSDAPILHEPQLTTRVSLRLVCVIHFARKHRANPEATLSRYVMARAQSYLHEDRDDVEGAFQVCQAQSVDVVAVAYLRGIARDWQRIATIARLSLSSGRLRRRCRRESKSAYAYRC